MNCVLLPYLRRILPALPAVLLVFGFPHTACSQANDPADSLFDRDLSSFERLYRESMDLETQLEATELELGKLETESARLADSLRNLSQTLDDLPAPPVPATGKNPANPSGKKKKTATLVAETAADSAEKADKEWKAALYRQNQRKLEDWNRMQDQNLEVISRKEEQLQKIKQEKDRNTVARVQNQTRLDSALTRKKGAFTFRFQGCTYLAYRTDPARDQVRLHWQNPATRQPFAMLSEVRSHLTGKEKKSEESVRMLTNAGMYTPANAPKGLYVEDGRVLIPVDSFRSSPREPGVNFYLQPNGIFWIDANGKPHIDRTEVFVKTHRNRPDRRSYPHVRFATQSGPMLVHGGIINRQFGKLSSNAKVRSGVGILPDGSLIFLCTQGEENFYNFSSVFRFVFNCRNALFLDGAISRMYLPGIQNQTGLGPFGPIISVTR